MAGKVFGVLCILSVVYGLLTGKGEMLSGAIFEGAAGAVEFVLFLVGMMALWNGLLNVWKEAGWIRKFANMLLPVLRFLFPDTAKANGEELEEIACFLSANLLGIGNAATPFALSALQKMQARDPDRKEPLPDAVTLTVLGTAPLCLLPTTIFAVRKEAGSIAPFSVLFPIWIASFCTSLFGVLLCRLGESARGACRKDRLRD